jgi:hypothetical protein
MAIACDGACGAACDAASAAAWAPERGMAMPEPVSKAPSMIVRRDARHCVKAAAAKDGAGKFRMRFVPVLREFTTRLDH